MTATMDRKMGTENKTGATLDPAQLGAFAPSLSRVPVTVQIVLGTAKVLLSDLLAMQSGSELSLAEKPGDPVTVLVNGCTIAKGELYVLEGENERFGVKISEIFEGAMPV